jgi:hypothetical protein
MTRPATEGPVIHAPVIALGMVARVPQVHIDLATGVSTPRDACRQKRGKQLGKQRDDIETHGGARALRLQ